MKLPLTKGKLLIALPTLLDPNFRQSVVLVCEHGPEGTLGLVINRPTELELGNLLEEYPDFNASGRLFAGGPVGKNTLLILRRGEDAEIGQRILQDVFLGKDLEPLKDPGALNDHEDFRCYTGYAGWTPEQLNDEIESGAWHILDADSSLIFDADPSVLWQEMIRRIGKEWVMYADMPPDPSLN